MDLNYGGKVVMISGGSSGIGLAAAKGFAREGADVSICSRDPMALERAAAQIEVYGRRCITFAGDLTSQDCISRWVDRTSDSLGLVDVLVNNASATRGGNFVDLSAVELDAAMQLKLYGYLNASRAVLEVMRQRKAGSIVNVIGVTAAQPVSGSIAGTLAGALLLGFTKALAAEVIGQGIRVNAVNPGLTATHRFQALLDRASNSGADAASARDALVQDVPIGRPATPDEIANVIVFVASTAASYMVGTTVNVDGGFVRSI